MRRVALVLLASTVCAFGQNRHHGDAPLTDVSVPQPQFQVLTPEQGERIATQTQALADLQKQVDKIEQSVKDIRTDVEVLKQTSWIFGFIVHMFELLVPGLICTIVGVWLATHFKNKPPRGRKPKPVVATSI
jgi:hypothetical protein